MAEYPGVSQPFSVVSKPAHGVEHVITHPLLYIRDILKLPLGESVVSPIFLLLNLFLARPYPDFPFLQKGDFAG
jgi:hypothetical protein